MNRRGFLKRLTAAAAALAAASSSSAPAKASHTPGVCVTADTSKFQKSLGEAGRMVEKLLRQCRVVRLNQTVTTDGLCYWTVVFKQADKNTPMSELDAQAWHLVEHGHLKEVRVSKVGDDLIDLNHGNRKVPSYSHYEIEATWLVPAL